jgi:predicted RecB family nuclease
MTLTDARSVDLTPDRPAHDPARLTLDGYAARSCAVKTYNAFHPGIHRPPQREGGGQPGLAEFAQRTYAAILAGPQLVVDLRGLRGQPPEEQQRACVEALAGPAQVVLGGLLPRDLAGHRTGRAELLVRAQDGGWVPGLVKLTKALDPRRDASTATLSALTDLASPAVQPGLRYRWHYRWTNAVHLAHLHRMLEAAGFAAATPQGLVVGTDEVAGLGQVAVWLDLADPVLPLTGGQDETDPPETALQRYDREFATRLALARQAAASDPGLPPDVLPVVNRECGWCAWWDSCLARLDPDDLSLRIAKSPLDIHEITVLREAGVTTVSDLAGADLDRLLLDFLPRVGHRTGGEDRLRLAQHRSRLLLEGIELDRTQPGPIAVPAAPLEIDVDIETSADDRVYLWGFWVQDSATGETGYHQVSRFEALDEAAELELAAAALGWLRDRVAGREALVYHYSDYEVVRLGRLAERSGAEVFGWAKAFAATGFVDLFGIVRKHFFGTSGLGLKVVATRGAGFAWRDADPGGLNSLQWFADAISPTAGEPDRASARRRILEYNEDDVRATAAVRTWLRGLA